MFVFGNGKTLKGIVHLKTFFALNLIFFIVMRRGSIGNLGHNIRRYPSKYSVSPPSDSFFQPLDLVRFIGVSDPYDPSGLLYEFAYNFLGNKTSVCWFTFHSVESTHLEKCL